MKLISINSDVGWTEILPVPKQVIENGARSQMEDLGKVNASGDLTATEVDENLSQQVVL